jgi:uncharacterized membrane protein (DUF4010 family)
MNNLVTDVGLEFIKGFILSLGLGLLMGLERERRETSRAGLRTFGLTSLLGSVLGLLASKSGAPWLLGAGIVAVAATIISAYLARPDPEDPGTTSVIALLLAYCYGAMVWYDYRTLAVMLAILTTILLYFKAELQMLTRKLTHRDLISMLQFGVLSLVVLPILPDHGFGPYSAFNPNQIWWMVVLISGISLAGYATLRIAGQRHAPPLLGVLGGMASSTATTLVYSRHTRENQQLARLALVVILTANLVVPIRLGALAAIFSPDLLPRLLPPLGGGLLGGLLVVAAAWYHLGKAEQQPDLVLRNPTEIPTALSFGLAYAAVLLLSAWLADIAGSSGLYAMATIAGLTDVDAITLSSLRLYGLGKLTVDQASNAVLIALCANLVFKLGIVFAVAGRHLGTFIAAGFAAIAIGTVSLWIFL